MTHTLKKFTIWVFVNFSLESCSFVVVVYYHFVSELFILIKYVKAVVLVASVLATLVWVLYHNGWTVTIIMLNSFS